MTTISYSISKPGIVHLDVYSINGQKVTSLVNDHISAGKHTAIFDGSNLGSGIYLYRFRTHGFRKTGKILLVK